MRVQIQLQAKPISLVFYTSQGDVEQRGNLFGAEIHAQICRKPEIAGGEAGEIMLESLKKALVHTGEVIFKCFPVFFTGQLRIEL